MDYLVVVLTKQKLRMAAMYFKVPLSTLELFVEVLNKMLLFRQKIHYYGTAIIIM